MRQRTPGRIKNSPLLRKNSTHMHKKGRRPCMPGGNNQVLDRTTLQKLLDAVIVWSSLDKLRPVQECLRTPSCLTSWKFKLCCTRLNRSSALLQLPFAGKRKHIHTLIFRKRSARTQSRFRRKPSTNIKECLYGCDPSSDDIIIAYYLSYFPWYGNAGPCQLLR